MQQIIHLTESRRLLITRNRSKGNLRVTFQTPKMKRGIQKPGFDSKGKFNAKFEGNNIKDQEDFDIRFEKFVTEKRIPEDWQTLKSEVLNKARLEAW